MVAIKDGQTTNGEAYRSYVCSNRESGCDFFETKYGDLTPPGILITEEMTAQDIERLRETRRNRRPAMPATAPLASPSPLTYFSDVKHVQANVQNLTHTYSNNPFEDEFVKELERMGLSEAEIIRIMAERNEKTARELDNASQEESRDDLPF